MVISTISTFCTSFAEDMALDEASGFVIDDGWELTNAHCALSFS